MRQYSQPMPCGSGTLVGVSPRELIASLEPGVGCSSASYSRWAVT